MQHEKENHDSLSAELIIIVEIYQRGGIINKMQNKMKIPDRINFKGLFIPESIFFDKRLSPTEKIFVSLIENGFNDLTLREKADILGITRSSIMKIQKKVRCLGYIDKPTYSNEEIKQIVIKSKSNPKFICEWCGCGCNVLQEHHYPEMKSEGGNDIVMICPNCHYEFHYLRQNSN